MNIWNCMPLSHYLSSFIVFKISFFSKYFMLIATWCYFEQVYTAEQQLRLGIDETGRPKSSGSRLFAQHSNGGPQDLPAASIQSVNVDSNGKYDMDNNKQQALPPRWLNGGRDLKIINIMGSHDWLFWNTS